MTTRTISIIVVLIASFVFALNAPVSAQSTTYTWTGGGTDDLWTNAANWGGTAPVSGDTGRFTSTGGGGNVETGSATDTWGVTLDSGANGYNILGTGTLSGPFAYNTSGTNTLSTTITASNNFGIYGGGKLILASGGRLTRGDTMYLKGSTIDILNGGVLGGLQSDTTTANRLRIDQGSTTNVINVFAGGLLGLRNRLHLDGNSTISATVNNSGTVTVLEIAFNNDNKRFVIDDGGVTTVTRNGSDRLRKDGGNGTVDMWTQNAMLALRGGDATIDTLPEFYALTGGTVGLDGDDFRYWDGSSYVNFDDMTGSDWYTVNYDADFQGSGLGYTVLETFAASPVPEPSSAILFGLGLVGLLFRSRWRRR